MSQPSNNWLDDPDWDELKQRQSEGSGKSWKDKLKIALKRGDKAESKQVNQPDSKPERMTQGADAGADTSTPSKPASNKGFFAELQRRPQQPGDNGPKSKPQEVGKGFKTTPLTHDSGPAQRVLDTSAKKDDRPGEADKVEVSINLTLPKFKSLKKTAHSARRRMRSVNTSKLGSSIKSLPARLPDIRSYDRRKVLIGGGIATILLITVVGLSSINNKDSGDQGPEQVSIGGVDKPTVAQYKVFAASGTNPSETRYDAEKQVSSFQDTISGVRITVSQQALPEKFKTNTADEIKTFAESSNFKDKLGVEQGIAYLGLSTNGPQSVVYQRDQTLMFLQSEKKIPNSEWIKYLNSLK